MKTFILLTWMVAALTIQVSAQKRTTLRQRTFPTPVQPGNVEWQRDIWRVVELDDSRNAGLFSPGQQGLFTRMFQLAVAGKVPVYRYCIDGDETFNKENETDIKDVLLNFHVFFQEENDTLYVDADDVPARLIKAYYIREKVFYNADNATYNTRVTALCPVLEEEDEMEGGRMRYPMFWMKYEDFTPYIRDLVIVPDYNNIAAKVAMEDYFTRNMYRGEIYKSSNAFGQTLGQQCASDSALACRQQEMEMELTKVRHTTYNTFYTPKTEKENTGEKEKPVKGLWWRKIFTTSEQGFSHN